jgi:PilZ domain
MAAACLSPNAVVKHYHSAQAEGFLLTTRIKNDIKRTLTILLRGELSPAVENPVGLPVKKRLDQRLHRRYPIALKVEYKLLNKGQVERLGSGSTVNISSGGIFFEPDEPLPAQGRIELVLEWPFLLERVCALKLVMRGRIVRSGPAGIAVEARQHEFRTSGTGALKRALSVFTPS